MKTHIKLLLCGMLGLMLLVQSVSANDPALEKMKPLLEDDTFVVVHVDLAKINPRAILENNRRFIEKTAESLGITKSEWQNFVSALQGTESPYPDIEDQWKRFVDLAEGGKTMLSEALGIRDAFLVMGLGKNFPVFGYVAIPMTDDLNTSMITSLLGDNTPIIYRETDDYFYLSFAYTNTNNEKQTQEMLASKLGAKRAVERPDLCAAYDAVKDYPIQLLFAPPEYVKKIVTQLRPTLPEQTLKQVPSLRGKIDIAALVNGIDFKGVGIDLEAGKLLAIAEAESEVDAQVIVRQADLFFSTMIDELVKYLEQFAAKKDAGEPLTFTDEIWLSFHPDVFNRESLTRLKNDLLPKPEGKRFTVQWDVQSAGDYLVSSGLVLTKLLQINIEVAQEASRRMHCCNNMKILALAMHNYHDTWRTFPPAYTVDENGKPLHSWRVLLLPYIEHTALYESIRLDEPWDSEHNRQFHDKMPPFYRCPSCKTGDPKRDACYSMVVGEESLGRTDGIGVKMGEITDGTSNTIMFVERKTPVCWMAPDDISFEDALQGINAIDTGIGSPHPSGVNVSLCDGSVHFISETIASDLLRGLLTIAGWESVSIP